MSKVSKHPARKETALAPLTRALPLSLLVNGESDSVVQAVQVSAHTLRNAVAPISCFGMAPAKSC